MCAIGTCDTAASTAAKVVTISGDWQLKTGTIIGIKSTYSNSAENVTLNVNNTGDKSIYYQNGVYTGKSSYVTTRANHYNWFQYDGTYWVFVSTSMVSSPNTMTQTEATAGTSTAGELISAKVLIDTIDERIAQVLAAQQE